MLLIQVQLLEHRYVLNITENLGLSFLTQLETDSEKIFLLQTHQVAGSHSCDRS